MYMVPQSDSQKVIPLPNSRVKLITGAEILANVIRPTLGPLGRTVLIESPNNVPLEALDDGGTIARRIYRIEDRNENMGAMLLREALRHQYDQVGDGTATAAVIFQGLLRAIRTLLGAGVNPMDLREPIVAAADQAVALLRDQAKPLQGQEMITRCALAICHDDDMSSLLGEVFYMTGGDGYVRAREWNRRHLDREYFEGCYWTGSWVSPHMITDPTKQEVRLENASVFVTDLHIKEADEILPVMEAALSTGRENLFLVVGEIGGQALSVLLSNLQKGTLKSLAVTSDAPYSEAWYLYEDLGYLTGAHPFLKAAGDLPHRVTTKDLGFARQVWATQTYFGVIAGGGDPRALRKHALSLRRRLKAETDREQINLLRKRVGKLLGGVATLFVGAATETEKKARYELAKRTIAALQQAAESGVLPGGGSSLVHCAKFLRESAHEEGGELGKRVMAQALEEPLRAIASNAGYNPSWVVTRVQELEPGTGFDVLSGEMVDMWEKGITDPVKIIESALQTAARTATLLMTTDVLVHSRTARMYERKGVKW
jgi:chaperonin GroEL